MSEERNRALISYNDSPDVPLDRSINPYRGCEHGCIYCFAHPTLDSELARTLEPRAAQPRRRLAAMAHLAAAGVPVGVFVAPLIPVLTEAELEAILGAAREAGAGFAGYVLLRLPRETAELFRDWLSAHAPLKAAHVMNRLRDCRGGKDYDGAFGERIRGSGPYADLIAQRFRLAVRRLGFGEAPPLDTSLFRPPATDGQLALF